VESSIRSEVKVHVIRKIFYDLRTHGLHFVWYPSAYLTKDVDSVTPCKITVYLKLHTFEHLFKFSVGHFMTQNISQWSGMARRILMHIKHCLKYVKGTVVGI